MSDELILSSMPLVEIRSHQRPARRHSLASSPDSVAVAGRESWLSLPSLLSDRLCEFCCSVLVCREAGFRKSESEMDGACRIPLSVSGFLIVIDYGNSCPPMPVETESNHLQPPSNGPRSDVKFITDSSTNSFEIISSSPRFGERIWVSTWPNLQGYLEFSVDFYRCSEPIEISE